MTNTITNLSAMVSDLISLRAQLSDLRQREKELKEQEASLTASILLEMGGAKSLHLEGLARIARRDTVHYEIRDREKLALAMLASMVDNGEKGMPMSEVIPLQQRVSTKVVNSLLETLDNDAQERYLTQAGLVRVETPALSVTKS